MTHRAPALCPRPHRDDRERPAADGLNLCRACRDTVERALAEMPALYTDLELALTRRRGDAPRVTGGGGGIPLPINLAAAAVRFDVETYGRSLAAWVARERGHHPPASVTPAACYTWLTGHVEWIAARPEAPAPCRIRCRGSSSPRCRRTRPATQ